MPNPVCSSLANRKDAIRFGLASVVTQLDLYRAVWWVGCKQILGQDHTNQSLDPEGGDYHLGEERKG